MPAARPQGRLPGWRTNQRTNQRGRSFGDVCFLGNGNELVFDDYQDIYLLDVTQRKVGWIAHGWKAVALTARYQRKMFDEKK